MEEQLPSLGVRGLVLPLRVLETFEAEAAPGLAWGIAARKATGAAFKCAAVFSTASHEQVDAGLFILGRFCS